MNVDVRPLPPDDLDVADAVLRQAFAAVLADTEPLRARYRAEHVAVLGGPVHPPAAATRLSEYRDRSSALRGCARLTTALHTGLDATGELVATLDHELGDVVLIGEPAQPDGVAICHVGRGTEAGSGIGYVKFAAARPDVTGALARILRACDALAAERGATRLVAGVATARREAYRQLLAAGFRTDCLGVAMHRPDTPGHDRPGVLVLDDRR